MRYLTRFMIAMVLLSVPACAVLWFTDAADITCGAIALAAVTYGCFDEYRSDVGLWIFSPLFGVAYILAASMYLLPGCTELIAQRGDVPAVTFVDSLVGLVVGVISFVWFVLAVIKNVRFTSKVRGGKSAVIVDAKDLKEQ